jgi:hypothetical protein
MDDYLDDVGRADSARAAGLPDLDAYYRGRASGSAPNDYLDYSARADAGRAMGMPSYEAFYRGAASSAYDPDDYDYSDDYEDSGWSLGIGYWLGAGIVAWIVYKALGFLFG